MYLNCLVIHLVFCLYLKNMSAYLNINYPFLKRNRSHAHCNIKLV